MSTLSAKNRSGTVARESLYTDLDIALNFHAGLKDIIPLYDLDAVKNAVKNLVLTGGGERLFHPEIGSDIFSYLFENANKFTQAGIGKSIETVLAQYEPRIDNVTVEVTDKQDLNSYYITINYRIKAPDVATDVNFYLERLR